MIYVTSRKSVRESRSHLLSYFLTHHTHSTALLPDPLTLYSHTKKITLHYILTLKFHTTLTYKRAKTPSFPKVSSDPFTILNSLKKVYMPKRWRYSHCHLFSSPIHVFNKIKSEISTLFGSNAETSLPSFFHGQMSRAVFEQDSFFFDVFLP